MKITNTLTWKNGYSQLLPKVVDCKRNTGVFFCAVMLLWINHCGRTPHLTWSNNAKNSIFEGEPSKNRSFPIKTRVIWVPGTFIRNQLKFKLSLRGQFTIVRSPYYKVWLYMGVSVFPKIGVPPNHDFNRVFHYKPSILEYPYFWKHPYVGRCCLRGPGLGPVEPPTKSLAKSMEFKASTKKNDRFLRYWRVNPNNPGVH